MHVIAVANRKGGVGKSTVAVNLASGLARSGFRVLLIDTDSQGSATAALLEEVDPEAPSVAHVFTGDATLAEIVRPGTTPGVDVAPGTKDVTGALLAIVARPGRETTLRRAVRAVEGRYDVVVIDTAPEQQLGTVNALVAATHVLLPFTPDPKALEGLATVFEAMHEINCAELAEVRPLGCVQVAYDRRLGVTQEARDQVAAAYGEWLLDTVIRTNATFVGSPAWHRDIYDLEKGSPKSTLRGSLDFDQLVAEVRERLGLSASAHAAA